ncbi:MAG: DUF2723 domain-containing protein [Chloroflexi bacterium]|jgi:hypothetical protein|nr:DUF2723 domain-containing protein [Chloroflexota bacterium]
MTARRLAGAGLLEAAAPVVVAAVAFALARSVLLPGQGFWDTGEFQAVPPVLGTAHPTGYPSYVILGWLTSLALAPLGEPALRMNLLSALLLGLAAGLTVVLVRQLTGRTSVAVGAGLLLALTPVPWRMGAFADPHTLHLALAAGLLVLLVGWERRRRAGGATADRWLVGAAALYGVMLGNHTLTILLAPGIGLFVLAVEPGILRRLRFVGLCVAALLGTTVALYLQLPIRAAMGAPLVYGTPNTWEGFWYVVLAEQFRGDLVDPFGDLARKAGDLAELAAEQLGILVVAVPAALLVTAARRPRYALLTGTWMLVTCWFAASYTNAAIDRYYLVPLLIAASWLGIGAGLLVDAVVPGTARGPVADEGDPGEGDADAGVAPSDGAAPGDGSATRWPGGRGGPWLVAGLVGVLLAAGLVLPAALEAPATRAKIDQSADTRARDWSRWVLETLEDDAVIVSWWSYSTPLWYRTVVLGERPDVRVLDDRDRLDEELGTVDDVLRATVGSRPVYLVRYPSEIAALEASWELEAIPDPLGQQPLYRVVGPRPSGERPVGNG